MAYNVAGTPPGFDVRDTADYLKSFDANWPLLKVHSTGVSTSTVNHGLGYVPLSLVTFGSSFAPGSIDRVNSTSASTTQLVWSSSDSLRYYIFRLDITTNFTAPIVSGGTAQSGSPSDYVFKMTKPGASIDSDDMRDFVINSDTKSPSLHRIDHGATSNTGGGLGRERTVVHGLGYTPTVFVSMRPGTNSLGYNANRYIAVPPPIGVTGYYYTVSSSQVYITADSSWFSTNPDISVVILKDPFDKEVINVSYP